MVTRYLQEQQSSYSNIDPGALLLGFLDFFGNHFDPRATGISVRRKEYFSRQSYDEVAQQQYISHPINMQQQPLQSVAERGNNMFHRNNTAKPPRIQRHSTKFHSQTAQNPVQSGRPYTFDPLFVEDPLSAGNNVGRNAFRIFQVKRAFADAYAAIMASLDWDMSSDLNYDDSDYPLLKCLLQNDDVFYSVDEIR